MVNHVNMFAMSLLLSSPFLAKSVGADSISESVLAADEVCLSHNGIQDCTLNALQTEGLSKRAKTRESSEASPSSGEVGSAQDAIEIMKKVAALHPSAWTSDHYNRLTATLPTVMHALASLPQEQRRSMVTQLMDTLQRTTVSASAHDKIINALQTRAANEGQHLTSSLEGSTAGKDGEQEQEEVVPPEELFDEIKKEWERLNPCVWPWQTDCLRVLPRIPLPAR